MKLNENILSKLTDDQKKKVEAAQTPGRTPGPGEGSRI